MVLKSVLQDELYLQPGLSSAFTTLLTSNDVIKHPVIYHVQESRSIFANFHPIRQLWSSAMWRNHSHRCCQVALTHQWRTLICPEQFYCRPQSWSLKRCDYFKKGKEERWRWWWWKAWVIQKPWQLGKATQDSLPRHHVPPSLALVCQI